MTEIRKFQFPSFEEWHNSDCQWRGKIGDYYCDVHRTIWSQNETMFGCAIAANQSPLNSYANPIVRLNFRWDGRDMNVLKENYESAVRSVNEMWVKRFQEFYFECGGEV